MLQMLAMVRGEAKDVLDLTLGISFGFTKILNLGFNFKFEFTETHWSSAKMLTVLWGVVVCISRSMIFELFYSYGVDVWWLHAHCSVVYLSSQPKLLHQETKCMPGSYL